MNLRFLKPQRWSNSVKPANKVKCIPSESSTKITDTNHFRRDLKNKGQAITDFDCNVANVWRKGKFLCIGLIVSVRLCSWKPDTPLNLPILPAFPSSRCSIVALYPKFDEYFLYYSQKFTVFRSHRYFQVRGRKKGWMKLTRSSFFYF